MFSNLDELRTKVQEVLASFTPARYWFSHRMALDFTFFISITSLKKWYQAGNYTDCPVEHEISSGQSSEVIDLNDRTSIHSNPVVQEVVKGKRRSRKTTTSPHQFTLFNLDDF